MNHQLLKSIIKSILLTEAPIDVWKAKNRSLPSEQLSQAETYFTDLTGKYIASLHPTAKDLTKLDFEQLETLYKTVETSKNKNLKSQYIQWITGQLKQLPDLSLQKIIEDYIPPLLSLQKNKEKFEPNFLESLQSIEELNKALSQKASSGGLAATVPEEHLGKLAEENGWILYMPHTTEASIELGKTGGRRDTTWCTTRPDSSNMFLQYSASPNSNIILFYVIKKGVNAETDPHAKMSVGFIGGEPKFSQGAGGVSVNATNNNLDQKKFEQVLGKDLASKFLQIMQEKAGSLKGEHPAKDEFRKLVQNPKAFQAKIDGFAKDKNGRELRRNFIEAVVGYKETTPEIFNILARDPDIDVHVRQEVAKNRKTPPETLTFLAGGKDLDVRLVVAINTNTPPETLTALAGDKDLNVRLVVAGNLKTPPETLTALAGDSNKYARQKVAINKNTPPETLTALAGDRNEDVRLVVAGNLKTPPETLTALAGDSNKYIRWNVAINTNTPPKTLTFLARDTDTEVRQAVARNPETPRETLTALAGDRNEDVRIAVAQNTKTPLEALTTLAGDSNKYAREKVAINTNTPPKTLTFLARDTDKYIRWNVAQNPETPRETLTALAGDRDKDVRWWVAGNLKTPPETLTALAADTDENVRRRAKATLKALKAKPLVEAIIMEKVWRKLLIAI